MSQKKPSRRRKPLFSIRTSMNDTPLHWQTLTALGEQIRAGALSPVKLTEHLLARIEALNGALTAFNLVTPERALAEARAAETLIHAGCYLGPLHGIPYAAKDIFDVAGLPTTAGSAMLADNIATEDSAVTARLARAGMVLLGKTITAEFARGSYGINHIQGTPHNPWHAKHHVPGGSSAGSAVAVAAGLAPVTLGSDTGCSVRAPSALCGTVGLKTTVGRVSRHGVFPVSWTLDSVGPLTRSVEDAALVYQASQGEDMRDESTLGVPFQDALSSLKDGVRGMRIAIPETVFFEGVDAEVEKAVRACGEVFQSLGAQVIHLAFPEAEATLGLAGKLGLVRMIVGPEACVIHQERMEKTPEMFDPVTASLLLEDRKISAIEYAGALRKTRELRRSMAYTLRDVEVLLAPTTMIPARPVAEVDASMDTLRDHGRLYARNTSIGNVLNLCGVSIPCGFSGDGLPIGLMLYGKPFGEEAALRVAYAYEQATDWHLRRPDLTWAA